MAKNCSPNPIPDNEAWRIFFDVYRNLPELWDENCTFYKSKHRRKKAYAKLLAIYKMICKGATHDALTKRLLNIKRCYRREMKKVKKFENVGEQYIPSLWYFGLLKSIFSRGGTSMGETSMESDRDTSVGVECCLDEMGEDEASENVADTDEDGTAETDEATSDHPTEPEDRIYEEARKRMLSYLDQEVKKNAQILEDATASWKELEPSDQDSPLQTQPPYLVLRKLSPNKSTKKRAVTNQDFVVNTSNGLCTLMTQPKTILRRKALHSKKQKDLAKTQENSIAKQEFLVNPSNGIGKISTQPQIILRHILPSTSQGAQINVQQPTINPTQPYLILRNAPFNIKQESPIKGQAQTTHIQDSLKPSNDNGTLTTQPSYVILRNQNQEKTGEVDQEPGEDEQPVKDEASAYAESWAMSFRQLSPVQKIYAKKAIEDILVLGQLECLSLNTVDTISASANAP